MNSNTPDIAVIVRGKLVVISSVANKPTKGLMRYLATKLLGWKTTSRMAW